MKKIYFEGAEKAKTLKQLMLKLFSWDNTYSVATFLDKSLTIVDCKAYSRRSFEDLLCIANTYFKYVSKLKLMQCLHDIDIHYYHCGEIKKIVFHFVSVAISYKSSKLLYLPASH